MYAGVARGLAERSNRRAMVHDLRLKAADKEISGLKNQLAMPPKKVGFFRNLFSSRGR